MKWQTTSGAPTSSRRTCTYIRALGTHTICDLTRAAGCCNHTVLARTCLFGRFETLMYLGGKCDFATEEDQSNLSVSEPSDTSARAQQDGLAESSE